MADKPFDAGQLVGDMYAKQGSFNTPELEKARKAQDDYNIRADAAEKANKKKKNSKNLQNKLNKLYPSNPDSSNSPDTDSDD